MTVPGDFICAVPSASSPFRPGRAWVSLEGIEGVGKTYLARRAARPLGPMCAPLAELPDAPAAGLPGQVIAAWRPLPHTTLLLTDDPAACLAGSSSASAALLPATSGR